MDEELKRKNKGVYPTDFEQMHSVLAPQIIREILNREEIIFFIDINFVLTSDIQLAQKKGFKVIQLFIELPDLKKRNRNKVDNEGSADVGQWLEGTLRYQKELKEKNLFDKVIDANLPTEKIAEELLQFMKG